MKEGVPSTWPAAVNSGPAGSTWPADEDVLLPAFADVQRSVDFYKLLGFEANLDEHKLQWLSVTGDDRYRPLFLEMLCPSGDGVRVDRSFFSTERLSQGGFGSRFYGRLGLKDGEPLPEAERPHIAAGIQRATEDAVIRLACHGRNLCLAGGLGSARGYRTCSRCVAWFDGGARDQD